MKHEILCVIRDLINKKFTRNIAVISECGIKSDDWYINIWLPGIGKIDGNKYNSCRLSFRIINSCLRETLRANICVEIADPNFIDIAINLITKEILKLINKEIKANHDMAVSFMNTEKNYKSLLRRKKHA